jgi:hypothetical protein
LSGYFYFFSIVCRNDHLRWQDYFLWKRRISVDRRCIKLCNCSSTHRWFISNRKKENSEDPKFNWLTGPIFSLVSPIIGIVMFLGLIKNVLSIFLIFRRANRDLYKQAAQAKRSKSVRKRKLCNLQIGDKVRFTAPGYDPIEGVVARFNQKTVKVINKPGESWNVPYESLTKLKQLKETVPASPSLRLIKG